jgi:raffinose/stachyose/melibiose transport system substrate-binding protein
VTIKRVAKSFTDLDTTLKLAVSGSRAPDVVEANQGRSVMGQLVKGGLLRPLDAYAKAYGWPDRWSKTLLDLNRFSGDGRQFGAGNLYGVSQMGEIVGVFYNKAKVAAPPVSFGDFERQLAQAKQAGDVPIAFGNLDKWPGIHEFQAVQNEFAPKDQVRSFVFARPGASFATGQNQQAAAKLREWASNGYFTPNFNGTSYDSAWQQFAKGKGRFLIAGTWLVSDLRAAMGDKVGFMLMPGQDQGSPPVSLGGESLPWAITSKSRHADVAAAYIDFLTNGNAANVLVQTDNLPAMPARLQPSSSLSRDVFAAWRRLNDAEGLVPYLDYSTPTFLDDLSAGIQRLLGGKVEPGPFTQDMQQGYAKFTRSL